MNRVCFQIIALAILIAGCKSVSVPQSTYLLTANTQQQCLQILREGFKSNEFWPSIHAAEALIDAGYTFEVKPHLIEKIRNERDRRKIAGYARALLRTGHLQAIVDLQDILLSDDMEAKVLAAEAMFRTASIGDPTIIEQLIDPESAESERLKLYAAAILTVTDRGNMTDTIREALAGDNPGARYIAADVIPFLGNLEDDKPILLDKKDLVNSEFELLYFVRALAMLGDVDAKEELTAFLSHNDATLRSRAAYALAESWHVGESVRLLTMLEDPSISVRVRSAQALLTLADANSIYRFLGLP